MKISWITGLSCSFSVVFSFMHYPRAVRHETCVCVCVCAMKQYLMVGDSVWSVTCFLPPALRVYVTVKCSDWWCVDCVCTQSHLTWPTWPSSRCGSRQVKHINACWCTEERRGTRPQLQPEYSYFYNISTSDKENISLQGVRFAKVWSFKILFIASLKCRSANVLCAMFNYILTYILYMFEVVFDYLSLVHVCIRSPSSDTSGC